MTLIDNQVTRLPNGVTNADAGAIFNSMKTPDPSIYHEFNEDFDYYTAGNWTKTSTGAGTAALVNGDGGLMALVNSAANADVNQLQKIGESFLMENYVAGVTPGKKFFMRARFQVDDATNAALAVGLQVTNADGTLGTVTDGIYWSKAAASTQLVMNVRKNAAAGANTANVGVLANNTMVTVDCFFDGIDRLWFGFNGTIIGSMDASTTFMADTTITPIMVVKNGTAVARTLTVDYLIAMRERSFNG